MSAPAAIVPATSLHPIHASPSSHIPRRYLHLLQLCRRTTEYSQAHATFTKLGFALNANPSTYNSIIRGYATFGSPDLAISLFRHVLLEGFASPNSMTFPSILKACSAISASFEARQIHSQIIKRDLQTDRYTQNALINVYVRIGSLSDSLLVFDRMSQRDVVSWNTVLAGMADAGFVGEAREIFDEMPERDVVSWSCLIDGYVKHGLLEIARQLFDICPLKNGITWNIVIGGYAVASRIEEARDLFNQMPPDMKDLTTFNLIIDICMKSSRFEEVLNLFNQILRSKIKPSNFTLVAALTSCSRIAALEQAEWIHDYIKKHYIKLDAVLGTALLDMYSKCGSMDRALHVFYEMQEKDICSWNSVISNLAIHGRGKEAQYFFSKLLETSTSPDNVTFLSVLSACRHSGLVEEGRRFFNLMNNLYKFKPTLQHLGCMVDLLCRAGLLNEAKELIELNKGMDFSVPMWGALLEASARLGNISMGEYAAKHLIELDQHDTRCYVSLSNLYSREGMWEDAARIRKLMSICGMEKVPGCSSVEVGSVVNEFSVGRGLNSID
ncbi:hypothetical protein M5K25_005398 [Dendrobium thyrsiflorum]|uniref:Pentatricopeptide repeat-containing protein n=1 Tax=Dendrobium thyrsiflorum TaxID=117978 RepID=A0ABD0VIJ6_DENTH